MKLASLSVFTLLALLTFGFADEDTPEKRFENLRNPKSDYYLGTAMVLLNCKPLNEDAKAMEATLAVRYTSAGSWGGSRVSVFKSDLQFGRPGKSTGYIATFEHILTHGPEKSWTHSRVVVQPVEEKTVHKLFRLMRLEQMESVAPINAPGHPIVDDASAIFETVENGEYVLIPRMNGQEFESFLDETAREASNLFRVFGEKGG